MSPSSGASGAPSESLREFIAWYPEERSTIYEFVRAAAVSLTPGSQVLDIGAGDAPYRELFDHCDYRTLDWEHSEHPGGRSADVISSADELRIEDSSVDCALLTQVLEHVIDPSRVLAEVYRVVRPGGAVYITVPLAWELHEVPNDFWRFTPWSLELLLGRSGFVDVAIVARNDCLATMAQLLRILPDTMGRADDGLDAERQAVSERVRAMADEIAPWAGRGLDVREIFPLGWSVSARRPSDDADRPLQLSVGDRTGRWWRRRRR
jgi:SAM-dependent methyltransferase